MDEIAFTTSPKTRNRGVAGMGWTRRSGSKMLVGTGFGNKRAVSDARVIMVLSRMRVATDVTSLGIKPSLPGGVGSPNGRGCGSRLRAGSSGGLERTIRMGCAGPCLGSLEGFILGLELGRTGVELD